MTNRLQVGIDFSLKRADFCLLFPDGQPLEIHRAFANAPEGYQSAKQLLLEALEAYPFDGLDVSGEATGYLWLPFFLQLADDPELALHDLNLYLLNPRWVHWFKKCCPEDDKCDQKDPFYIAERTRTRSPQVAWSPQLETLPLRFYTRARFHLVQNLAREKCYFSAFLFLAASAYYRLKPFSDIFGVTSRLVLGQQPTLDELAAIPVETLADQLYELSGHHLPDPLKNARKLQRVAAESFALPPALTQPVQRILDLTLDHIRYLESQIARVEQWVATEVQALPAIATRRVATIPGVGPVFSSGIGAEIGNPQRFLQGTKWDKRRKRYRPKNFATPRMRWPNSPASGGHAKTLVASRLRTGVWPRAATAICATTSSKPLISCVSRSRSTPLTMHASTGKLPNTTISGLWSQVLARAWASLSGCYTAMRPIAPRRPRETNASP